MSTVFLSYSSDQAEAATRVELSLKQDGHTVFRDRSSLPPGEGFDSRIRSAVEESDVFVFLISRVSVSPGRYTLTELKFVEQKWGLPAGRVLPVLVEPVPKEAIPAFLRAVTILSPQGDLAAEVAAEVARMTASSWRRLLQPRRLAPALLTALVLLAAGWLGLSTYLEHRAGAAKAGELVKQAQPLAAAGNYAGAWDAMERAGAAAPASGAVADAQEQLAMVWLDHAVSSQPPGGLEAIADKVSPVLSRGAIAGKGERSADLMAHLGWADFFRLREGAGGLDPAQSYRRAAEMDSHNVFAHAMWAHWILWQRGPLADAQQHFAVALESGRMREYVRTMQLYALMLHDIAENQREAIRVANDIRSRGEALPPGHAESPLRWKLWDIHYHLAQEKDRSGFLQLLPPAEHLATLRWLYSADLLRDGADEFKRYAYLFMLAELQEASGDGLGALASYRMLLNEQANMKYDSSAAIQMAAAAKAAIARLSR